MLKHLNHIRAQMKKYIFGAENAIIHGLQDHGTFLPDMVAQNVAVQCD